MRMRKFLNRGYNIQVLSMSKVIARLIKHREGVELSGKTENETADIIAKLLYEVDPLRIIDGIDFIDDHSI